MRPHALSIYLLPFVGALLFGAAATPARAVKTIRGPWLQNASAGTVTIRWEQDRLGLGAVEIASGGETPRVVKSPFDGRKHRAVVTGLRPGETYRYRLLYGPESRTERITEEYRFRATPAAGTGKFTFVAFGDFGAGTQGQRDAAKMLDGAEAEFALLLGDLIYGRGEEEHYDTRFFEPYRRSLRRMTFWPALGNHDVGAKDGAALLAAFDVPANGPVGIQTGRNYSFDYGNTHIVAFDSNASASVLKRTIGPWLESDLKASKATWKIVFMHHPPFSSAGHGEDPKIRDTMVPFFERGGASLVLSGHDHSYERIKPRNGVTYMVSGNGGARLYEHKNPHAYTEFFYNKRHGMTFFTVDGPRMTLRHVNADGKEIDRAELTSRVGPEAAR